MLMLLVRRGQYFLLLSGFHGTLSILPFYQRGQGVGGACMVPAELRVEEADEGRLGQEREVGGLVFAIQEKCPV